LSLTYFKNSPKLLVTQSANAWAAAGQMRANERGGVNASEASMQKGFAKRPTLSLDQKLAAIDRAHGVSDVAGWSGQIATYIRGTGAITTTPKKGSEYITDACVRRLKADPELRDFAASTR